MTDQDHKNIPPNGEDQARQESSSQEPNSEHSSSRPGDRLRRMLSAEENEDAVDGLPVPKPEDRLESEPLRSQPEPVNQPEAEPEVGQVGEENEQEPGPESAESTGAQSFPEGTAPIESISEAYNRPEAGTDESDLNDEWSESDRQTGYTIPHHPTGDPSATGGWYGEMGDEPGAGSEQEKSGEDTRAVPVDQPDPSATRPVPVNPQDRPTIPPNETTRATMLPRRVEEVDPSATRVTPAAYRNSSPPPGATRPSYTGYTSRSSTQRPYPGQPTYRGTVPPTRPPAAPSRPAAAPRRRASMGCVLRGIIAFAFLIIFLVVVVASIGVIQYYSIAAGLPDVSELRERASQFETTRILDRNGDLLYEIIDPNAGRRTYVPLERISPYVVAATIATEDSEFYSHPGFDPLAIGRALWQNYTTGSQVGASTITQQLARNLLLDPEERTERTVQRKAREIVLAAEISRQYSRDEVLELYLNENYYSNLAYGIEAAAQTYFNKSAADLDLAEATFLAGIPQSPAVYDIFSNPEATLRRHKQVLVLTYQMSQQDTCIYVSNSENRVCVDALAATDAVKQIEGYTFQIRQESIRFPHWVNYIRSILEEQYDAQTIYRSGFTVTTTLDPNLQELAQSIVSQQVSSLADRHVTNGALVAIRPNTGEVLAMVGSADFYNEEISGQVNMAAAPRQPGSSIKPINYLAAFEKGWTPATLIWDVPTDFPPSGDPNDTRPPYQPVNYDERFHGPVLLRDALANSFNVPAVKTLNFVRIYDDPTTPQADGMINMAKRLGITTLTRDDYGLALTLGGGDVSLVELTGAYSVIANGGRRMPPVTITKITDYQGNLVYEYAVQPGEQVLRPEHAYLMSSILSDNNARAPMFGTNSVLNLGFQVAAKTGTTNDFRDNWTLGYTPDLAVGVWVGNADYTPMINTTGLTGAAPIWSQFFPQAVQALTGGSPSPFIRPDGIVEKVICASSGTEPSEWCPSQKTEIFAYDQGPLPKEQDLWQRVNIDTWTNLKASAFCSDFTDDEFVLNVTDPAAQRWIRDTDQGRAWADSMGFSGDRTFAPDKECGSTDSRPTIFFAGINEGQSVNDPPLDVYAVVYASSDFSNYRLQYGLGDDPVEWRTLREGITDQHRDPALIYTWDMEDVPNGPITLRIYMESTRGTHAERRIRINNQSPTATPTQTATQTETPLPSTTPTPTVTMQPPTVTPTVTQTSEPTP